MGKVIKVAVGGVDFKGTEGRNELWWDVGMLCLVVLWMERDELW